MPRVMILDKKSIFFLKIPLSYARYSVKSNSYFYIEKWTFKGMCNVYNRAKRDIKERSNMPLKVSISSAEWSFFT